MRVLTEISKTATKILYLFRTIEKFFGELFSRMKIYEPLPPLKKSTFLLNKEGVVLYTDLNLSIFSKNF